MEGSSAKRVVVVYGTQGGMGDVGKFAAVHAQKLANSGECTVKVVAMFRQSEEGTDLGFEADVYPEAKEEVKAELRKLEGEIIPVDVDSETAQASLETAFEGADAVVACLGNRQPDMARWLSLGAEKVVDAMGQKGVNRLVILSSMGIGEDFMPFSFIHNILWPLLLNTLMRSAKRDLQGLERVVEASDLNYLIVKAVGLTPEEKPEETWHVLQSRGGDVEISIAKSDMAAFMLQEALQPTMVKKAVTAGSKPKKKGCCS
uniref:NAD(P)-binding domain-containing protein n=1 Tax=Chromera velia CCMP2878 TaxID=1169474 RepID=A0A0G4GSK0_9ALVE|eukprot:Cvel_5145.t1-p1 / transcript=Cvel_5145.t1 / gene=Cvel_5145 / organism=Chromera_velia_CCMP2878 / gene_product=hypothetical protein / transcript_product=hypothetical protein / location=Cvel_scaffold235:87552-88328(+) / protein_length=259 / sequence_SO=supercontig / SO=protein_coding / is_pseudo=false